MAYVRSLREIPLDQEPHASVLAALTPDPDESPQEENVDWASANPEHVAHVRICPACEAALGGIGRTCIMALCDVGNPTNRRV